MEYLASLSPLTAGLPLVLVGLVEVVKRVGLNARYLPLCAVIMGVAGSVCLNGVSSVAVIGGIVAGLLSVGLFSGSRASVGK